MSEISAVIEQEVTLTSGLIELLTEEQDALKQGDIGALSDLGARKTPFIQQLNALSVQRSTLIDADAELSERDAMQAWLRQHDDDQAAAVNWEKLLNFAREAKALHELNSQLVEMQLRQTTEILGILTQQSASPSLYGASGQSMPSTGSRLVDSA